MPAPEQRLSLSGTTVLVTRPRHQAQLLCQMIKDVGGDCVVLPVIEIIAPQNSVSAMAIIDRLEQFDLAIFISANAVEQADDLVRQSRTWPLGLPLAVIGRSSAAALQARGLSAALCPEQGFNSEALLALPALQQLDGQRIIIFRGEGGREKLAQQLTARGAQVEYAEVYRRQCPTTGLQPIKERLAAVDVIVAASNESLQNLYDMAGNEWRDWLLARPLVVISQRAASLAATLAFQQAVVVAAEASNEGMLDALLQCCGHQQESAE